MTDQPKTLRERFTDHAVSAGFPRQSIIRDLDSKQEQEGGYRPYHHEIVNGGHSNGHYADVNKDENDMMVGAVSTEKGVETVYRWKVKKG